MNKTLAERIVLNPSVMVGKPIIKGTRIPVELIVRMVAQDIPIEKILDEYPRLEREDVRAALNYAADVIARDEIFLLTEAT